VEHSDLDLEARGLQITRRGLLRVSVVLRKMTHGDLDRVLEIENSAFSTPWSRSAFEAELRDDSKAHYLVACKGEDVIGYIGGWFIFDEAHITNIAVDVRYRGQGVGKQLLSGFIDYCKGRSIKRMTLEVRKSNHVAIGLYEKHGFRTLGVRRGYYVDTREDALLMWKEL
jgi:ribosomal-protein-alanine N-acetyltransferase